MSVADSGGPAGPSIDSPPANVAPSASRRAGIQAIGTNSEFKTLPGVAVECLPCRNTVQKKQQIGTLVARHLLNCKSAPLAVKQMACGASATAADLKKAASCDQLQLV